MRNVEKFIYRRGFRTRDGGEGAKTWWIMQCLWTHHCILLYSRNAVEECIYRRGFRNGSHTVLPLSTYITMSYAQMRLVCNSTRILKKTSAKCSSSCSVRDVSTAVLNVCYALRQMLSLDLLFLRFALWYSLRGNEPPLVWFYNMSIQRYPLCITRTCFLSLWNVGHPSQKRQ